MSATGQAESAEEWRPIPGFPGYEVSNMGRVLSHRRGRPRVLRQSPDGRRYQKVVLYREDLRATRPVHVLVALAFIGPRPAGLQIRHLDGNSDNNRPWNLKYGTPTENMQDRFRHGTNPEVNKTECRPGGHPYSDDNTYITPSAEGRAA
jgi:hypothetical protein